MLMPIFSPVSGLTSRTFVGKTADTSNSNNYTFSTVSIGSGDYLVVAIRYGGASGVISGATVNGGAFTYSTIMSDNQTLYAIIKHPGGATADFGVTGTNGSRCVLYVYTLSGVLNSTTPYDTADTASDASSSIDVPDGGFAIGIVSNGSTSAVTFTAGLTADDAAAYEGSVYYTCGSRAPTGSSVTGLTVSVTAGSTSHTEIVWR